VLAARRYSVPILGKYLVIIANPANHPLHTQSPVLLPFQKIWVEATPPAISAFMNLIGGHFSA
jgi:hypothetical protein